MAGLDKHSDDFIKGVYSGAITPNKPSYPLIVEVAMLFIRDIFKGYGSDFNSKITQGDYFLLSSFHKNAFLFSGCKNIRSVMDLQKTLIGDDGFIRPYKEFKKDALKYYKLQYDHWLKAERNTAISLSQSAARWEDVKELSEEFPYLEYWTKEDAHVRKSHQALDGIIKKVNDPFWSKYYPPLDWQCRCEGVPLSMLDEATETPNAKIPSNIDEGVNPLFANNPGKTGEIFTNKHPFIKEVTKKYPYIKQMHPPTPDAPNIVEKRAPRTKEVRQKLKKKG